MTEQNDKSQASQASQQPSDKVQNYKIYVYREPELNTIGAKVRKKMLVKRLMYVKVLHRN